MSNRLTAANAAASKKMQSVNAPRVIDILLSAIEPDPGQIRQDFASDDTQAHIRTLADDIAGQGILSPLSVYRVEKSGRIEYRLLNGECRYRAAQIAGLKKVPCIEVAAPKSEAERIARQIGSNKSNPEGLFDRIRGMKKVMEAEGKDGLAAITKNMSKGYVAKYKALVTTETDLLDEMVAAGIGDIEAGYLCARAFKKDPAQTRRALAQFAEGAKDSKRAVFNEILRPETGQVCESQASEMTASANTKPAARTATGPTEDDDGSDEPFSLSTEGEDVVFHFGGDLVVKVRQARALIVMSTFLDGQ